MDYKENGIEFLTGQKTATVDFTQRKMVNRIKKLAEEHPDECKIVAINQDGSICAHVPVSWIKISPPRKIEMTDERRKELSDRMNKIRNESKSQS